MFDDAQSPEPPRINEPEFASGSQLRHRVRVLLPVCIRSGHQHAACHPQVNDPLDRRWIASDWLEIEDDVLARAADTRNPLRLQRGSDLAGWRLQRLRFRAKPDGFDHVTCNPLVQATRNRFDFGKLRHGRKSEVRSQNSEVRPIADFRSKISDFVRCNCRRKFRTQQTYNHTLKSEICNLQSQICNQLLLLNSNFFLLTS